MLVFVPSNHVVLHVGAIVDGLPVLRESVARRKEAIAVVNDAYEYRSLCRGRYAAYLRRNFLVFMIVCRRRGEHWRQHKSGAGAGHVNKDNEKAGAPLTSDHTLWPWHTSVPPRTGLPRFSRACIWVAPCRALEMRRIDGRSDWTGGL